MSQIEFRGGGDRMAETTEQSKILERAITTHGVCCPMCFREKLTPTVETNFFYDHYQCQDCKGTFKRLSERAMLLGVVGFTGICITAMLAWLSF